MTLFSIESLLVVFVCCGMIFEKIIYNKENVFQLDNIKVKKTNIHNWTYDIKKNTLKYGYYLISLKMLVEHGDPIFNLRTFISNANQMNKFFVHSNHKLIDCYIGSREMKDSSSLSN